MTDARVAYEFATTVGEDGAMKVCVKNRIKIRLFLVFLYPEGAGLARRGPLMARDGQALEKNMIDRSLFRPAAGLLSLAGFSMAIASAGCGLAQAKANPRGAGARGWRPGCVVLQRRESAES